MAANDTLLGIAVGTQAGNGVVYDRGAQSSTILSNEARVKLDSTNPNFVYGANRLHYRFLNAAMNTNALDIDHALGRLPVVSHRYDTGGTLWTAVAAASPSVNVALYNNIAARGDEIAAWQDTTRGVGKWGCTFPWSFHHEPNQNPTMTAQGGSIAAASANWRAALQNILTIWETTCGVSIWQGTSNMHTTTEGIIPALNLVSGSNSGHDSDFNTFWGNDAYMNAHCVMAAGDPYNTGVVCRTFADIYTGQKAFCDAKAVTQAAAGKPFMPAIWETATDEPSDYTSNANSWQALGIPYTKAAYFANMNAYIKTLQMPLFCYYDDGPAHPNNLTDSSQAAWNGWIASFCNDAYWGQAADPIPGSVTPPPAFAGAVSISTRVRMTT